MTLVDGLVSRMLGCVEKLWCFFRWDRVRELGIASRLFVFKGVRGI